MTPTARTLADDLLASAGRAPGATALVDGERRISYAELRDAAIAVAAGLAQRGVTRGDRVAIVLPNGAEAAIAFYGALLAGAAAMPLNPTIKGEKLDWVVGNSSARVVLHDAAEVTELAAATGSPPPRPLDVDLAALIYTSGSTGRPKGVTLTHRNMTFAAGSLIEYLEMHSDDRILCVLPLSFDYGLYQLLMCVRLGATLVIERGFAFPGRVVGLLESEKITGLPGVPTVFQVLSRLKGLAERELPDLRLITNTGAALPVSTIADIRRMFPRARLYSMYGLTECKRVSYLPPEEVDRRPSSVGIAIPGTEVWVERGDGTRAAPGEVGQLVVRGGHVMQGYWDDPEATAKRLRPGRWPWERELLTGDLFRTDDEGFLYFVGRTDDIIKSRGEKVAPREVEDVLHAAPGVHEAAVVGIPDELLGQAICAHVTAQPGATLDPAALRRHCTEHLEDYMVPKHVEVHDALPKTANGKIDKQALAEG